MSELKKCPFCGGEVKFLKGHSIQMICCTKCNLDVIEKNFTKEELINKWNTRADDWISVEDRLPEKNKKVMIFVKSYFGYEIDIARLDGKKKDIFRTLDVSYELENVEYWQPLPEPPKGD